VGADLVLANDPDADRCAAAVPDPASVDAANPGGWRMLRGDEVGALLGAHILSRGVDPGAVFASSIVSSRLLAAQAAAAGVRHAETLTGFKWIARVPGLRYGYEEALGYCVDPASVQDKDGVTAALLLAEMAAGLRAQGRTLLDVLDDLALAHGVHATDALSVRVADLSLIGTVMQRLRSAPPTQIGGVEVRRVDDLAQGSAGLPPTDGLRYHLADDSRVIVRPSGTEPKLKVYLEVVVPVAGPGTLGKARTEGARRLARVRASMAELTAP
jgi:phosphomannomutase